MAPGLGLGIGVEELRIGALGLIGNRESTRVRSLAPLEETVVPARLSEVRRVMRAITKIESLPTSSFCEKL